MKFKKIPREYLKVILDRLLRLKPAYLRLERVFSDIINKFYLSSINDDTDKFALAAQIFNLSVDEKYADDTFLNEYLKNEEQRLYFKNPLSETLLDIPLNLTGAIEKIKDEKDLKLNVRQLIYLNENRTKSAKELRKECALLYPVEKVILCEGATEEILLGELARQGGYDFLKNGVYLIGAGGKNQVARSYYKMVEDFRIPIFVLLDSDASATKDLILPKLRPFDRIYVIRSGEFEDLLPKNLIINALNDRYKSGWQCSNDDFENCEKTAKELHEIYKQKGFGEYKKADFAKIIKDYIAKNPSSECVLSFEATRIIEKIKSL